jgi:hypothetical protein
LKPEEIEYYFTLFEKHLGNYKDIQKEIGTKTLKQVKGFYKWRMHKFRLTNTTNNFTILYG